MSFNAKAQFDKWLTSLALSTLFIARRVACPFACIRCSNHTQPRREALDESSFLPKNTTQKAQPSLESCPLDLESNPVLVIYKLFTLGFVSFSQQDSSALNAAWQSKQQLQEKRFFVCAHWLVNSTCFVSYLNYVLNTLDDINNLLAFEPCCSSGCLCFFQIEDEFLSEECTSINEI